MKHLLLFLFISQFAFSQTDSLSYYYKKGELDKAIRYGEYKVKTFRKEDVDYLIFLNDLAAVYSRAEKFELSEKYYLEHRRILINLFGEQKSAVAKNYNNIGNMYFANKKYEKAKDSFIKSLDILLKLDKYSSEVYVKYLIDLAIIYFKLNELDKAEEYFLQIYQLQKVNLKYESIISRIDIIDYIALISQKKNKLEEANKFYLESLELKKKHFGENNIDYAIALNNLALNYKSLNLDQKAEFLFLKAIEIRKKVLGENHYDFIIQLNNLADLHIKQGDFQKAEALFLKSIGISKAILNEKHPYYSTSLIYLIEIYMFQKKYQEAEPLYLEALEINKKVLGENHTDNIKMINSLAFLYKKLGNYKKAAPLYLQALEINKKTFGENHTNYASSIDKLASLYKDQAMYQKAESLYLESLEIIKKILGENHLDYATSLNNIASLYDIQGVYQKAESMYLQALVINKKVLGEKHPTYATSLNNLACLYTNQGNYQKAEPLHLESLEIRKNILGKNHLDYAISLNNLASLYEKQGMYQRAEPLCLESLEIKKNILGKNHLDYAISLNNLASLYEKLGIYQKAEALYFESLENKKKNGGENHPDYATSLNNLAGLYSIQGSYQKAESFYLQALGIIKNILGENHQDYALFLNNLASLYEKDGKYQKAELLYLKSLEIQKTILGRNHPDYAISLNNLAGLYSTQGSYQKAESLYLQVKEINKKVLGQNHPNYFTLLNNLAWFYQKYNPNANNYKVASCFQSNFFPFQHQVIESSTYMSEEQLRAYRLHKFSDRFIPQSFLSNNSINYPEINSGCFENELLIKTLSLRNQQRIKNSIDKSNDAILKEKYQQFVANKRSLTKLEELPLAQRPLELETLKTETENLEKEITRQSTTFANAKKSLSITWKQIQDKLQINEVAIDLVSYNYYNKKWTDSIMYGAFVVKKDSKFPKYIPLFEEKQLKFLMERNSKDGDTIQARKLNKQYSDKAISDLFLKPLEKELQGISTVYLSPSGLGHQIDFSALPVSESQTLGDKYSVHILGSTSEIVTYSEANLNKKTKTELVLYGNIDYKKSDASNKVASDSLATKNSAFTELFNRSASNEVYGWLEGSKIEINKINALAQQNNIASTIVEDRKATEESIKAFDGRTTPFVLHLATHGFFFPDPKQELLKEDLLSDNKSKIFKTADNPMMRSGLILAGANKNLKKSSEVDTMEDGILTASEISNLDFSACQLVVLSACETGLGQINGSEGVFGLQRAFKMAGVKNIIMSLWKVPDAQTAELFEIFYAECFAGKTIHEAFQTAQAKMKAKYSPYYWAGFVLLE